jgi:hypothetical protein
MTDNEIIKTLKMENEKLQNDCELLKQAFAQKIVSEIKSEAIKEFAEKIIEKLGECRIVNNHIHVGYNTGDVLNAIDNLVKEMVDNVAKSMPLECGDDK